jgi:uncharacterized protein (TIGR02001 family)
LGASNLFKLLEQKMKFTKNLLAGSFAVAALAGAMAPAANAEVAASATVSSSYLWRGFDLGPGTPAVSGDIVASSDSGFYGGLWISSGDGTAGTEYDLFAGYGGEVGDFTYDINLTSYVYPTGSVIKQEGNPGDFMEVIVSLGYGPVSFSYYDNIAGENGGYAPDEDYNYMTLSADAGKWSFLLGSHDIPVGAKDATATHLDITYSFNDNISFTMSSWLDVDDKLLGIEEPEPQFVVSYSIAID